ncbi:hypothetical protein ACJMK2_025393 [Sinanodonta woodiana]|uniref:Uncharacterized protein n=1 Tax=Sinanodonta woodiana TaxID=1069815 RepID=A0ABD3XGE1_SINWO
MFSSFKIIVLHILSSPVKDMFMGHRGRAKEPVNVDIKGLVPGTGGGMQLGLSSLQQTFLPHPCISSEHICLHTRCVDGLQTGPGGCQYCACATKHTDTPATKETSTVPSNISNLHISTMPIISVNLTDINSHVTSTTTTQGVPTTKKVFTNPCILSMNTCDKDCGDHYVKGPEGCEYCLCQTMPNIPTTTAGPSARRDARMASLLKPTTASSVNVQTTVDNLAQDLEYR